MLSHFLLLALPLQALAQVTGTATGFATGVTGGGDATPAIPSDTAELEEWLTDDTPRVIMLDKTYDFLEAEGTATETGCVPSSNTCGSSGQNALDGPNWCSDDYESIEVTYYVAPTTPIDIKGNKSIVGVGDKGVIRGKGIRLVSDATNVIIQNVHFTELNPQYIWGGDAIQMSGTDLVWIDHCKFSLIGRQMIVSGYETAGRVTISNNEFDGETSWSASCNGEHYWTMLFLGAGDQITLANNYIHDVSGRSPKLGSDTAVTMHAVNNYWLDSDGHNFDIDGANVLMEGNVFDNCKTPILEVVGNLYNVPDSSAASGCSSTLGRACVQNSLTSSGDFDSYTDSGALSAFASVDNLQEAMAVDEVAAYVLANAGIGKLSGSASTSTAAAATSTKAAVATSSVVAEASSTLSTKVTTSAAATSKATSTSTSSKAVTATSSKAAAAATTAASSSGSIALYAQCGGQGWTGSGSCVSGTTCKQWNDWYHQCVSE
ncbi:pectin lyase F [Pestalotiopsis fici W106-1]|uniref:pectin lyase n=1 Tax=Pestalotiopsis fici (strain W106-1 / CGMCC3.15140) TaxID=1229662 RepID=W3XHB6_PESFW|nr:pectin lyase F [Pestalotiopsis fici W106-1]ETS85384.1 pectin lyase F [Pestalotiopsis fici W106-1]